MSLDRKEKFTKIYSHNLWNNEESRSGGGSTVSRTTEIRACFPQLFREKGIQSVCDAGCGDFNWMRHVDLSDIQKYVGVEIVQDLVESNNQKYGNAKISFIEADICHDILPTSDIIICREVLFHLSLKEIAVAINNFKKSGSKYVLTTHFPNSKENVDIVAGQCRELNFQLPPFNLAAPIYIIRENLSEKCLALWDLESVIIS